MNRMDYINNISKLMDKTIIQPNLKKLILKAIKGYTIKDLKDAYEVAKLTAFKLEMENYLPNRTNGYIDEVMAAAFLHNLTYKYNPKDYKSYCDNILKSFVILTEISEEINEEINEKNKKEKTNEIEIREDTIQNIMIILKGQLGNASPIFTDRIQINNPGYKVVMACQDHYLLNK